MIGSNMKNIRGFYSRGSNKTEVRGTERTDMKGYAGSELKGYDKI